MDNICVFLMYVVSGLLIFVFVFDPNNIFLRKKIRQNVLGITTELPGFQVG